MSEKLGEISVTPAIAPSHTHKMDSTSNLVNPERAFVLPLVCSEGISADNLFVEFSPAFDRLPHSDARLESSIDQTWEERLARQPSLFNGSKFRVRFQS